jgi:hypothetical protein
MNTQIDFGRAPKGMPVFNGVTYDEHVAAWRETVSDTEHDLWKLGAIAASLIRKHGDGAVVNFAKEVGLGKSRIYEIEKTYKTFENSTWVENLKFKVYQEAKEAADPHAVIAIAATKGWRSPQVKRYVETGLEPGEKSDIDVATVALSLVGATPIPAIKIIGDQAMIDFCLEARSTLVELGIRCPKPKFKQDVIDGWIEELDDHLEKYTLESLKEIVIHAWAKGNREESQIAKFANVPTGQIHAVMLAYKRDGLFEKVVRAKTEGAKGTPPWVWHLVGQPLGSDYVRVR